MYVCRSPFVFLKRALYRVFMRFSNYLVLSTCFSSPTIIYIFSLDLDHMHKVFSSWRSQALKAYKMEFSSMREVITWSWPSRSQRISHTLPLLPPPAKKKNLRKNILDGWIFSFEIKLFESVRFPSMGIIIHRINASEPSANGGHYKKRIANQNI